MTESTEQPKGKKVWIWDEHRMSQEHVKELEKRYKPGSYRVSIRPSQQSQKKPPDTSDSGTDRGR